MAGISDDDIRRVREATDIVALFADTVPMRRRGRDFVCCCPFHDEKSPSCYVHPDGQYFHCFGCGEGGDVFSYVMKREGIEFPDAVRRLAERAGITIVESGGRQVSRGHKTRLKEVCRESAAYFHNQLMRSKTAEADRARAYLTSRGLGGPIPKQWNLGFAPGNRGLVNHLHSLGFKDKELVDANVAVERGGRGVQDRFFNRIMFPIADDAGDVIAFSGRVVDGGEPKYLNSSETDIFHKSNVLFALDKAKAAMASTGSAVVVEGYTDVISLHAAGMTNVVATMGTALTPSHIRLLSRHARRKIGDEYVHRIIYLFDGDAAGQKAADRALSLIDRQITPEAGQRRLELLAVTLPDDLDPADFVAKRGVDALKTCLDGAVPLISFGIERRLAKYDLTTAEGRSQACEDTLSVLAPIKDSLLAKDYAVQIAGRLQMRENDITERLAHMTYRRPERAEDPSNGAAPAPAPAPEPSDALDDDERARRRDEARFISLCARYPSLAIDNADALATVSWHDASCGTAADFILETLSKDPAATSAAIIGPLTHQVAAAASLIDEDDTPADAAADVARRLIGILALADLEDTVSVYRAKLRDPASMSNEEYELLFETVSRMQREIKTRREALD